MTDDADLARVHTVLREAIRAWLSGLGVAGGVHWQRALTPPEGQSYTRPFVAVQLRRAGDMRAYVGGPTLWRGEVTIWCVDGGDTGDQASAEALARSVAGAIPEAASALTDPGGGASWDASIRALPPPPSVPTRQQASAGLTYRVELMRRAA